MAGLPLTEAAQVRASGLFEAHFHPRIIGEQLGMNVQVTGEFLQSLPHTFLQPEVYIEERTLVSGAKLETMTLKGPHNHTFVARRHEDGSFEIPLNQYGYDQASLTGYYLAVSPDQGPHLRYITDTPDHFAKAETAIPEDLQALAKHLLVQAAQLMTYSVDYRALLGKRVNDPLLGGIGLIYSHYMQEGQLSDDLQRNVGIAFAARTERTDAVREATDATFLDAVDELFSQRIYQRGTSLMLLVHDHATRVEAGRHEYSVLDFSGGLVKHPALRLRPGRGGEIALGYAVRRPRRDSYRDLLRMFPAKEGQEPEYYFHDRAISKNGRQSDIVLHVLLNGILEQMDLLPTKQQDSATRDAIEAVIVGLEYKYVQPLEFTGLTGFTEQTGAEGKYASIHFRALREGERNDYTVTVLTPSSRDPKDAAFRIGTGEGAIDLDLYGNVVLTANGFAPDIFAIRNAQMVLTTLLDALGQGDELFVGEEQTFFARIAETPKWETTQPKIMGMTIEELEGVEVQEHITPVHPYPTMMDMLQRTSDMLQNLFGRFSGFQTRSYFTNRAIAEFDLYDLRHELGINAAEESIYNTPLYLEEQTSHSQSGAEGAWML